MKKTNVPVDIRRGDILWVQCDPSVGVEPQKTRTCIVVSNDVANRFSHALTVVPTQSHTAERAKRPYMVDLRRPRSNLDKPRVANASMVMTYDRSRVVSKIGRITKDTQKAIDRALEVHLGLREP